MQELRPQFPIAGLLKLAQLPRSTFYYQLGLLDRDDKYGELKEAIKAIFARHKGRYGYRRITSAVRRSGHQVNHKVVQRLMGVLGLKSLVRPKKYRSFKGEVGQAAPNELQRQFKDPLEFARTRRARGMYACVISSPFRSTKCLVLFGRPLLN